MRTAILDKYPVITRSELNRILTDMIRNTEYLSDGMTKDLYKLVDSCNNTELEKVQENIGEEVNKMDGVVAEEIKEENPKKVRKKKDVTAEKSKKKVVKKTVEN